MLSFQDILIPDKTDYAFECFDTCMQSCTYLFYVLCPKLALNGVKIGTDILAICANILKIGSNIFAIYAFFSLCHNNLQVMTLGAEDRVQTLSLGLEAPPFEGVF